MKIVLTLHALLFLSSITFGQTTKDLDIDYMLRGRIYAQSSIEDSTALGGFGRSSNSPLVIHDSLQFSETGFFLKIDTTEIITIDQKYNGYKFFIANKSDSTVKLDASDSRLSVVAEVFFKGEWQPIEYLPSSWCGNSYHRIYLKENEYWVFSIPKFKGKIKTKLRYKLIMDKDEYIYSNEIQTSVNKKQLTDKEGHKPQGIMDPYND